MNKNDVRALVSDIDKILNQTQLLEEQYSDEIKAVHPDFRPSAANLLHYLAFRDFDLRDMQEKLSSLGLSSLGRAEAHVLPSLQMVRLQLLRMIDEENQPGQFGLSAGFDSMSKVLRTHSKALFGDLPMPGTGHIMVTLATEMATNENLLKELLQSGMSGVRINCAHDDAQTWKQLIDKVREASKSTGIPCKVFMDLAGPKIRTGELVKSEGLVEIRPTIGLDGKLAATARVWLVPEGAKPPEKADAVLQMPQEWLRELEYTHKIRFTDTRGRKRMMKVQERNGDCVLARISKNATISNSTELWFAGPAGSGKQTARVGNIPEQEAPLLLFKEDLLVLHSSPQPGEATKKDALGAVLAPAHVACTLPEIFKDVEKGHRVLLNDGKIEGKVLKASSEEILIKITYANDEGSKLRSAKGINFPDSELQVSGLTEKDREDLAFVARHADVVNMSFVNTPADVQELLNELKRHKAETIGVVLKIETARAFNNLPLLLLKLMQRSPAGIMIARGDMAVEVGWNRLAEVQEEMLWLCEASHIPVIWATQVLENLAKKGRPSRSEITDAAMSQRAECVMLNKGPYILDAVRTLSDILQRMHGHQFKKSPMLRKLEVADMNKDHAR